MMKTLTLVACICSFTLTASADPPSVGDLGFTAYLPTAVATRQFNCHGSWDLQTGGSEDYGDLSELQKYRLKSDPLAILDCDVQSVSVRQKKPETHTEADLAEFRRKTLADIAKSGGWAKFKEATLRHLHNDTYTAKLRKLNPNEAKLQAIADSEADTAKFINAVKECATAECCVNALIAIADAESNEKRHSCSIDASHQFMRFERQGDGNRWIRTQDETKSSVCGTMYTYALEFKPTKGSSYGAWTYTIKWVNTNPDGFAGNHVAEDFCKHDGTEQYFSAYEYAQKAKLECTYIEP